MVSILSINPDDFFLILNYIPNIREKLRLRRTCRHFNWLIQQYFKCNAVDLIDKEHIHYKGAKSENNLTIQLSDLINVCHKLKRLRNDIIPIHWNLSDISTISYLKVIEIDWRKESYRFHGLDKLLSKCVHLRELGLIGFECDEFTYKPRHLTSLCLDYCSIPFNDVKELIIVNARSLIRFEYHNLRDEPVDSHDYELIDTVGYHCRELQTLRLCVNPTSIEGLKSLNNLNNLFLIMNISGQDVRELMKANKHLQWMVVHQKDINYEEALVLCIQYCPEMRQISINNNRIPLFSQHEINLWRLLPNLRYIHGRPLQYYEDNLISFASE